MGLVKLAKAYVKDLKKAEAGNSLGGGDSLARFEPHTVMVDFIRVLTKGMSSIRSNYYLGRDESEGDNSDNGHFVIKLD